MVTVCGRSYSGALDLERLIEFASGTIRAHWPQSTYMKGGDIVWALYASRFAPNENVRIWSDGGLLLGYAIFEPPLLFYYDVRPDDAGALSEEILAWAESRRRDVGSLSTEFAPVAYRSLGTDTVSTTALQSDRNRITFLEHRGYERTTDRFEILFACDLADLALERQVPSPDLTIRHVTDTDFEERVDVHRDAWSVWGKSGLTIDTYRLLRSAPLYEPELDIVLEDSNGRFLAYSICWIDHANAIGHFEPVGCRPDFAGRGFARAVIFEGMRRMRDRGISTALVATPSINQRAIALYKSCGFVEVDRAYYYAKKVR